MGDLAALRFDPSVTTTCTRVRHPDASPVELVELFHLGIRERKPQGADVFGDALTMGGLWQHDEVMLEAPADQDLRRDRPTRSAIACTLDSARCRPVPSGL